MTLEGEDYLVRIDGDELSIGQQAGGETTWFPDTVPLNSLPADARKAVEQGSDDEALDTALRGVVSAFVDRGA